MEKKRKRRVLIDMEERQLVLNSAIIERYPKLKEILKKYERIYEKDIMNSRDFDDELKNIILYVFSDIKAQAEKEWYGTGTMHIINPSNPKDRIKCSLCGTRNVYIYYIINRHNNKKLNVGSECIERFPGIDTRLPGGMTPKQYKNKRMREYAELKRLEDFNKVFPDARKMLSKWNTEYSHLPIILPTDLHNNIMDIHKEANMIFKNYIKGKDSKRSLIRFGVLIDEREKLMLQARSFITKNKDNKFVCTREIYNWLIKQDLYYNKEELINDIRNNSSTLNGDAISLIYERKFIYKLLDDFKKMIIGEKVSILGNDDKNIYFQFRDDKEKIKIKLYLPSREFMKMYGKKIVEKSPIIKEEELILKSRLVVNETNYIIIKEQIENILEETGYKIELDYDNLKYGLEFTNENEKTYADRISPHVFFNNQKGKILLKSKNVKEDICKDISKINNWRPLSDKYKFNIGDISKKPEDREY